MYVYCIIYIVFEEYAKKPDHWCNPFQLMTAITFSDAKTECSENVNCHMFFDAGGAGNRYLACEITASIKESGSSSILYQKPGNNLHKQFESFRFIIPRAIY